jgi:hypothetical protein
MQRLAGETHIAPCPFASHVEESFSAPTDARERRQPPLSSILGKNTPAIRTLPDDPNNQRSAGFSRNEAENLAHFFDSHADTPFDEENASLYL